MGENGVKGGKGGMWKVEFFEKVPFYSVFLGGRNCSDKWCNGNKLWDDVQETMGN